MQKHTTLPQVQVEQYVKQTNTNHAFRDHFQHFPNDTVATLRGPAGGKVSASHAQSRQTESGSGFFIAVAALRRQLKDDAWVALHFLQQSC